MGNQMKNNLKDISTKIDHLDFYLENSISPVRQNIENLSRHLDRRNSLYRYLGLTSTFFEEKDVLEVGPGSGHNSLYVASCLPKSYDLLEPNLTGQNGIIKLYNEYSIPHKSPKLIKQRLEDFNPEKLYDVVISECWLGISSHERRMMEKLGTFLKPGGILITTLASPIGAMANAFRRLLSNKLTNEIENFEEKSEILVQAYGAHLDTMNDMTRPHLDWVQDCMINPGFMTISITPEMFMESMRDDFEIYNSYPRFDNDWRWYKSLYGDYKCFNERYIDSYYKNSHNFFDYNSLFPQRESAKNIALEGLCLSLLSLIITLEENNSKSYLNELNKIIDEIQKNLEDVSTKWSKSIEEFKVLFKQSKISVDEISKMKLFKPVFGRELIYISAIKS
jgi:hypothetical protein